MTRPVSEGEVPESIPATIFDDTGPIRSGLAATVEASEGNPTAHAIATALSAIMRAEAPTPPPPPPSAPPINLGRRPNWMIKAIAAVIALGGASFAAYKITEARSVTNQEAIKDHSQLPAHPKAAEEMRLIHVRIGTVQKELSGEDGRGGIKGDIKEIAKGVKSLRQEAQTHEKTRLQEKVKALERANRLLERGR